MCGICGVYNYQANKPIEHSLLKVMIQTMTHRGPDDKGSYIKGAIGLGMRRLSIIDVKGGRQPIHNEDRTIWTVFNGEIYNFPALRKRLQEKGHLFYTSSDTEVIVHAYEEWGDDCLLHFNGIFGLAIWDANKQRLLLARDPFGVKPLYYYDDGQRMLWGSEIKSILADSSIPRVVDCNALNLFLTFRFTPSPFTLFKGIIKIAPGHLLVIEKGDVRGKRYHFSKPIPNYHRKEKNWVHLLRERLETAVLRQMISDVPIGVLLSGGIDSAVILAIMCKAASQPVHTFTVGFADGNDVNELAEARLTAEHFKTEHHEVLLNSLDYRQWLRNSIWHLEEPNGTTSALPMYFVSRLASSHVKAVLTGQGADEPLCGYHRYYGERYGRWFRKIPRSVRDHILYPIVETIPRQERIKRAIRSLGENDPAKRFVKIYAVFNQEMRSSLWRHDRHDLIANEASEEIVNYWRKDIEDLDPLIQMAYVDVRLSLADDLLMYGDKMSMAASIEARVPFLDIEYMDTVESLPASQRIRGVTRKYMHKKVIAKWLPESIIRRKKRGFETPMDQWFQSELSGYVKDMLLSGNSACLDYFRPQTIDKLITEHINGVQNNQRQLFCLLNFEIWHKLFIKKRSY